MKIRQQLVPVLTIAVIGSAKAASVLDLPGEELLRQAAELRVQRNLTATQAGSWLHVESMSRDVLREQKARQERFQIELREDTSSGPLSVESLAARIDSEDALARENRRMLRQA